MLQKLACDLPLPLPLISANFNYVTATSTPGVSCAMPRTVLNSSSFGTWVAKVSIRVIIGDSGV